MPNCECSDPGCPVHKDSNECGNKARYCLVRGDTEDESGTLMCMSCGEDAEGSGLFRSDTQAWIRATTRSKYAKVK